MVTYKQLQEDRISAIKEKNKIKRDVISNIMARAKSLAIELKADRENIPDEIVEKAVLKEKKMCEEGLEACPSNRPDLIEIHTQCLDCINEYAPKMMDEAETRKAIYHIFATVDIQKTGKGALMQAIMPRLKGKAEGKTINKIVSEIVAKTGE